MGSLFCRMTTDGRDLSAALEESFCGPVGSSCWLIGGGPSLAELPCELIAASPAPVMAVNLAGTRLLRPNFWTSYDPSARFHRSVYLDAGIMKFVHRRRAMDLVPETTFKVCECPNLYFFQRDGERGFHDFLSPGHEGIVDWADSMAQAIDILYRLGFRTIYLAGCELRVRLSAEQWARLARSGVEPVRGELLTDLLKRAEAAGIDVEELEALPAGPQYHFDEHKSLRAAAHTDAHYFRVSQYLRLSRRAMASAGLRLVSVTPESRLNDHFPYETVESVCAKIAEQVGNPATEPVRGLYRQIEPRHSAEIGPMRDFKPHNWQAEPKKPLPQKAQPQPEVIADNQRGELAKVAEVVAEADPTLEEVG